MITIECRFKKNCVMKSLVLISFGLLLSLCFKVDEVQARLRSRRKKTSEQKLTNADGGFPCGNTTCFSDECCVNVPEKHCKKLESKLKFCPVIDDLTGTGSYAYFCPCQYGLECDPTATVCRTPSEVAASLKAAKEELESSPHGVTCGGTICGPTQCCINAPEEHCVEKGGYLDLCGPVDDQTGRGNYAAFCPCGSGLSCDAYDTKCKKSSSFDQSLDKQEREPSRPRVIKRKHHRKNRCLYWWC